MNEMRVTKNTVENLYEFLSSNKTYADYVKLDLSDEDTKQSDDDRRFRAFILMAHLTNELCGMGLFDDDDRLKIVDMLDDVIIRKVKN